MDSSRDPSKRGGTGNTDVGVTAVGVPRFTLPGGAPSGLEIVGKCVLNTIRWDRPHIMDPLWSYRHLKQRTFEKRRILENPRKTKITREKLYAGTSDFRPSIPDR